MLQLYPYGAVPPRASRDTKPLSPPEQVGLETAVLTSIGDGAVIVNESVSVQRFESVTTTVYVPATRFDKEAVVCTGVVFQL